MELHPWRLSLLRGSWRDLPPALVTLLVIGLAAAMRIWPLGALGTRTPWLTFYPAVMAAAAFGGLVNGLSGTLLACLIVVFGWPLLVDRPFIQSPPDWLGMAFFFLTSLLLSFMAEGMLQAKARALRARNEAEAANRSKSVFLANMSHELRTPLNAVLGFATLLRQDENATPEQRRQLDFIHRSGRHLLALIDDVLDLAKVESGRLSMEPVPCDLQTLVKDLPDIHRPRAEEKGLRLAVEVAEGVPGCVVCDPTRLRQVFTNLLGNAIRYTAQGTVTLRLSAEDAAGARTTRLLIEVEDTGRGISPEDQTRIFEPFVQLGASPDKGGAGLGLAITRRIVEMMGGRIQVRSRLGEGTVFRVEVELELPEGGVAPQDQADREAIPHLAAGQPSPRILIVEDQEENWRLLQALMTEAGFTAQVAENGLQGVERYLQWHPDLIWMDCRMPVMDGLEATRRIRALEASENRAAVRIVALTASVFQEEREQVLEAGMDDFIRKPYRNQELFACLARQLGVVFQEAAPKTPSSPPPIDPGRLRSLPEALRRDLTEAVLSLDRARISDSLRRAAERDPELGAALEAALDSLAYTRVLKLLSSAADESP